MPDQDKISVSDFASKIKSKYPEYKDIDDSTLTAKMLEKYPEYKETVSIEEPVKKKESTTSTPTLSPFGEELRKGLSTRAVSESTKVKPDQTEKRKDIEVRAAKTKDEAIKNTLKAYKNRISGDGLYAISDDSPTLQKHKKELEEGLASGDYQIIKSPTTNKQILARKDNFLNSLQGAINSAYDKSQEDVYFSNLSPEEKVKHIEAQKLKQDEWLPSAPSGLGGGIGTAIGENIGGLVKASYYGTLFASGAGELGLTAEALQGAEKLGAAISFIKDMGFSGYTDNAKHTYEKLRQQDPKGDKVEQMKHAEKAGLIGEGTGVLTAGLMGGAFSKLKSASAGIELSGMAKSMESMAKHTVKEANAMGGYQALSSIVSDLGASSQGVKFDAGETLEKAGESYKSGAEMVAIMSGGMALLSGAIQVPKYVESQIKGTISKLPREDVKNVYQAGEQNGVFPEGTTSKVMGDLDEFDFALNKISKDIPDEHRNAIAGLQVKINRLDRMKESLSEAEHPRIDELTNKLKERQQTILKSENFLKGEVDEITGIPATDKPIEPTPPSKDDLTPVITVDGKEYEGDNHGEAMDKAIADGKDIPDRNTPEGKIWREENGQFRENNIPNSIPLTRNETEDIYGIRNSEQLLPKENEQSQEQATEILNPTEVEKPSTETVSENIGQPKEGEVKWEVGSSVGGDVESTTNILNETQKSNPTVWQKIKDAFNNLVSNTKEYLSKAKGTQYEELAKVLGDHLKNVRTSTIEDLRGILGEKIGGQLQNLHILVNSGKGDLQTFFHEALHHITFGKISQYLNNNHENLKPHEIDAIQNLQRIFEDSKTKIAAMKIKTSAHYGFTNLHEFISEAFSNPEFQRLLKELPSEGKSPTVFKAFLDAIAKLMGLKDATILNDIFHHTEKLLDNPKSENEGIAELYHQAKAEGTHPDFVKAIEQSLPTKEVKKETTNETKPTTEETKVEPTVEQTKETIPNKETELPKEKEKPKTEKPKIKLEFVEPKKLAEKGDALANKEEHDRIKESHKSLRKIIDCLWT
jgi:hypothetical protein